MVCCFLGQQHATATAPNPALGNALAAACGLSWALTLISLRHLNRDFVATRGEAGLAAVVTGNAMACALALPFALPIPHADLVEWSTLIYLGAVQVALAYVFLTASMRVLPALEVSLLLLLEPVLNPFWTWLVRGERPGLWTLAGGALIVAVTGVRTRERLGS
jgi:drug/metabolite transporter (DMT)-like permease